VAPFAALLVLWDKLPARIPVHWNLAGEADRWSSSRWEVLLLPLFCLGAVVLCRVLPRLDPKLRQMSDTGRMAMALQMLRIAMACLFGAIFALQIAAALGSPMPTGGIATAGTLLFLAVTGNYLGNLRQNYFFGLRTPWTLEDEETWRVTHRRGGELLFFGSSALLLLSFIVSPVVFVPLLVGAAIAFIIWAFLFSWHHYHRRRYSGRAA
jgi:uncharacterized membrane protein